MVMTEVVFELQGIKQVHKKAMGIQRQSYQLKFERVKEKLEMVESRLRVLEEEIRFLKSKKPTLEKKLAQSVYANTNWQKSGNNKPIESLNHCWSPNILAVENVFMISSSSKVTNGVKSTKLVSKNYAQIVVSKITQSVFNKFWTKVISGNWKQKSNAANSLKVKPKKKWYFGKKLICFKSLRLILYYF